MDSNSQISLWNIQSGPIFMQYLHEWTSFWECATLKRILESYYIQIDLGFSHKGMHMYFASLWKYFDVWVGSYIFPFLASSAKSVVEFPESCFTWVSLLLFLLSEFFKAKESSIKFFLLFTFGSKIRLMFPKINFSWKRRTSFISNLGIWFCS